MKRVFIPEIRRSIAVRGCQLSLTGAIKIIFLDLSLKAEDLLLSESEKLAKNTGYLGVD